MVNSIKYMAHGQDEIHGWGDAKLEMRRTGACSCSMLVPVLIDLAFGNGLIPIPYDRRQRLWHGMGMCRKCRRRVPFTTGDGQIPWYNDELVSEACMLMGAQGCRHPGSLMGSYLVEDLEHDAGYMVMCRSCKKEVFIPKKDEFGIENVTFLK